MKYLQKEEKGKSYGFLCLENQEDVKFYAKANEEIKSRQAVDFWMGFKSQTWHQDPLSYIVHQSRHNTIGVFLANKMQFAREKTSILDFCNDSDSLISEINTMCLRFVNQGQMVRINGRGGYCPIDNIGEYNAIRDISPIDMYNFILNGGTLDDNFNILSKYIIIENDPIIPHRLIKDVCEKLTITDKDIQVLSNFRLRTILFKKEDFCKLFIEGMGNGMDTIAFTTTAQDIHQIEGLTVVLEYCANKFPEKTINVLISIQKESQHLFKTKCDNIKIQFL